ncbi:MAG: cysteine synthase [Proteobacteria bacterium]|nr:cysteine synthase [Pseudomonadota bacterium]
MDDLLSHIGNTPLVEITRMNPNPRVRILAKVEYMNPGGSIKDRAALAMIRAGEASGELTQDKIVLEATSGNTGIGLALVCSLRGYRLTLAMSEGASEERRKILKARGAEILLTSGHLGTDGAIEEVYRMVRENPDKYFATDQFNNPANWQAHYETTGVEIWEQTKGEVKAVVATLGTSGTLMGVSRRLKEYDPAIRVIGVEPYLGHKIQGLKNMKEAYVPEIFDKRRLDEKVNVDDEDAYETARRLAREEGLFVGMSSGAAMFVAMEKAREMESGVLVVILPDGGERYLSTTLFAVKEKADLFLFNTMGRAREAFVPRNPGRAGMYTCGPAAHGPMDLTECRRLVFADLVRRYLDYKGLEVVHAVHLADLDDKTIAGSQAAGQELSVFADKNVAKILADLKTLGVSEDIQYLRASEHVDEMTALARKLADKGFAYEKLRSLYFDISRLAEYGKLSGLDLDKIRVGATVDLDEYEKDNPRDFTLFKRSRLADLKRGIYMKTPWGNARPSWHIQCAAVAVSALGESFDLHVSSRELLFPHHENERAISMALTGKPLSRYWLHCEHVEVESWPGVEPGESISLDHLLSAGYTGREVRYWLVASDYKKPLVLSPGRLDNARAALARLDRFAGALTAASGAAPWPELDQTLYDLKTGFTTAMNDDLSVLPALATLFSLVKAVNRALAAGLLDAQAAEKVREGFFRIHDVVGVLDLSAAPLDDRARVLMEEREAARKDRDFERADAIRRELEAMGVMIRDCPA